MEHAEDTHQKGNKDKDNTDTPQTTYWLTESKQCKKGPLKVGVSFLASRGRQRQALTAKHMEKPSTSRIEPYRKLSLVG